MMHFWSLRVNLLGIDADGQTGLMQTVPEQHGKHLQLVLEEGNTRK